MATFRIRAGVTKSDPNPQISRVTQREVRRPLASTAQDDELLLEQEIFRDDRSHATGATHLRGHDGQVKQSEQELFHARNSVGQTAGATQRCFTLDSTRELAIRDPHGEEIHRRG